MPKVIVPVEGTGVVHQGEGPGGAHGQRGPAASPRRSSAPGAAATQGARGGSSETGAASGAQSDQGSDSGQSPLQAFGGRSPSAGAAAAAAQDDRGIPAGMGFVFDKFGRAKLVSKEQAEGQAQEFGQADDGTGEGEGDFIDDVDDSTGPPVHSAAQRAQGAQGGEVAALQSQVNRLTDLVELLTQSQLQGKPIAELTGRQAKPAAPVPPDASKFSFDDPQDVAEFQRQNNVYIQAVIQQSVADALAPHREAMEGAKWQTQYNQLLAERGREPNFTAKAEAALRLVQKHPSKFSIPEAYSLVSDLFQQSPPQKQQGAQRKLTPEQAQAKREAAKKLPAGNGGASGGGRAQLPSHITKLGAIMAFNRQFGRSQ